MRTTTRQGAHTLAHLLPWAVVIIVFLCLCLVSLFLSGASFDGYTWTHDERGGGKSLPRWFELDSVSSGVGVLKEATPDEMLDSIRLFWGLSESGLPVPSDPLRDRRPRTPPGLIHVTVIGEFPELSLSAGSGNADGTWRKGTLRHSSDFQYRVFPCGQDPAGIRVGGGVDIVVLGECKDERSGETPRPASSVFELFASLYQTLDNLHAKIRRLRRALPRAIVAYLASSPAEASIHLPPLGGSMNASSIDRSWERRKSEWWGWNALAGRTTSSSLRRSVPHTGGANQNLADDVTQLWSYLLIRHICVRDGVPVMFGAAHARHGAIETLLWQLEALRFKPHKLGVESDAAAAAAAAADKSRHQIGTPHSLMLLCAPLLLTRKHSATCMPPPNLPLPVLLTTLGGGGTHHLAQILQQHGVDVLHEGVGSAGSVAWMYASNDAILGTVYPHHAFLPTRSRGVLSPRFARVIHVTRQPLAHISSFTAHLGSSYAFVRFAAAGVSAALVWLLDATTAWPSNVPRQRLARLQALAAAVSNSADDNTDCLRGDECNLSFAVRAWLFWDALVELQADSRVQVEGSTEALVAQICATTTGSQGDETAVKPAITSAVDCVPGQEEREAGLLRLSLAALYRGYNFLAGRGEGSGGVTKKLVHKQHREYSLSDLSALPPLPAAYEGTPLIVGDQVAERARSYGYNIGADSSHIVDH